MEDISLIVVEEIRGLLVCWGVAGCTVLFSLCCRRIDASFDAFLCTWPFIFSGDSVASLIFLGQLLPILLFGFWFSNGGLPGCYVVGARSLFLGGVLLILFTVLKVALYISYSSSSSGRGNSSNNKAATAAPFDSMGMRTSKRAMANDMSKAAVAFTFSQTRGFSDYELVIRLGAN